MKKLNRAIFRQVEIWERIRDEKQKVIRHKLIKSVYSNKPYSAILDEWLVDKTDCYCRNFKAI